LFVLNERQNFDIVLSNCLTILHEQHHLEILKGAVLLQGVSNKVVIIDSSSKVRNHVAAVMEFMAYEPVQITDPENWQSRFDKTDGISR